jgi:hypothetical protein
MRWFALSLVLAACHAAGPPGPPSPPALANRAADPTSLPLALEIARPTEVGERDREVRFEVPARLASSHVQVLDLAPGHLLVAQIKLIDAGSGAPPFRYVAALPHGEVDVPVAIVLAPTTDVAAIALNDDERHVLDSLSGEDFMSFGCAPTGLDLDGDQRADVAFVIVCHTPNEGDNSCSGGDLTWYAVHRVAPGWQPMKFCERGGRACGKLQLPEGP